MKGIKHTHACLQQQLPVQSCLRGVWENLNVTLPLQARAELHRGKGCQLTPQLFEKKKIYVEISD